MRRSLATGAAPHAGTLTSVGTRETFPLGLARGPVDSFLRPAALGSIGLVDPLDPPTGVTALRIFAGYAGWDPGQLEDELEEMAWWVVLADVHAIFGNPVDLWRDTIRRAPGRVPLFETYTDNPSAN